MIPDRDQVWPLVMKIVSAWPKTINDRHEANVVISKYQDEELTYDRKRMTPIWSIEAENPALKIARQLFSHCPFLNKKKSGENSPLYQLQTNYQIKKIS